MNRIAISPEDHGKTLLNFLCQRFPIGLVHKLLRKRAIRVNEQRAKAEQLLQKGDEIHMPSTTSLQKPKASALDILLDHEDFFVINKPPGISVHAGKTVARQESLEGQLKTWAKSKDFEPLLVHRLDAQTSGCLLIAKHSTAQEAFEKLFGGREIEKQYLVLVKGQLKQAEGDIKKPLPGRDGQLVPALSHYRVQWYFPLSQTSMVKVKLATGRKHQIRLHFAGLHHPVLGDSIHGDFDLNRDFRARYGLKRQFLHAEELRFLWKNQVIEVHAPLSPDLQKVLGKLKS